MSQRDEHGTVTNIANGGVVGIQAGNLTGVTIHVGGTCGQRTECCGKRCEKPAGHRGAHLHREVIR
jgi:hypothetical protein